MNRWIKRSDVSCRLQDVAASYTRLPDLDYRIEGASQAVGSLVAKWEDYVKGMEAGMPKLSEGSKEIASYQILMAERFIADLEALAAAPSEPPSEVGPHEEFQHRVHPWMLACFGAAISSDKVERNHRFLEEALELVHSCGTTKSEAHQLVDYVYGRPIGQASQEVGGVMVTLAALCLAQGLDMHASGETELSRIWTKVEEIRAKQAAKPKHSPLAAPAPNEVGEPQDFNAKFGGDIYVVTGEHQRTAFFSKAAAERYLAKQDPKVFKIIVYAKPGDQEVGEGLATYLLNTSVPDWEYDKVLTMAAESLAVLAAPAPKPAPLGPLNSTGHWGDCTNPNHGDSQEGPCERGWVVADPKPAPPAERAK